MQDDRTDHFPPTMTRRLAAIYVGLAEATLETAAVRGGGPKFLKLGRAVRYRKADLDAFLEARLVRSTSDYPNLPQAAEKPIKEKSDLQKIQSGQSEGISRGIVRTG